VYRSDPAARIDGGAGVHLADVQQPSYLLAVVYRSRGVTRPGMAWPHERSHTIAASITVGEQSSVDSTAAQTADLTLPLPVSGRRALEPAARAGNAQHAEQRPPRWRCMHDHERARDPGRGAHAELGEERRADEYNGIFQRFLRFDSIIQQIYANILNTTVQYFFTELRLQDHHSHLMYF